MKKLLLVVVGLSTVISCPTYEAAAAGKLGEFGAASPFLYLIPPSGAAETDWAMLNFQSYALNPVPEPNVIPLTILGIAAVWLLRRKK